MATSVRFADAARRLGDVCRALGLEAPGFRSPPGDPNAERSLRRRPEGGAIVAVKIRGRPLPAVKVDMVEGVIAANRLSGPEADQTRYVLLAALDVAPPARAA